MSEIDEKLETLWVELEGMKKNKSTDEEAYTVVKNQLAEAYYHIVKDVAERMAPKLKEMTTDECESYGVDGLYDAIEKFDKSLGNKFKTFAPYRIRGSILDNIRKADWVPRLVRYRNNKLGNLTQSYFKEHGEYPTEEWLSDKLDMDIESYYKMTMKSLPISVISLNAKANKDDDDNCGDLSQITTREQASPIDSMLRTEMLASLWVRILLN